ncbi:MAG: hypothetical protein IFNCLDLE_02637 [Ignavibacteriaceae bacterium]|nr:hypothetical protein [Ignavibacteriaceae bacterium]
MGFLDNLVSNISNALAVPGYMFRTGVMGDREVSPFDGRQQIMQTKKGNSYAVNEWGKQIPISPLAGNQALETTTQAPPQVATPQINQVQAKEAYQPQSLDEIKTLIDRGFQNFNGGKSPVATLSAELAATGKRLSDGTGGKIDPMMAAIIALKESRGGLDPKPRAAANYFNIMKPGKGLANYGGNPARAISHPTETLNFEGLLRQGGVYQNFRDSGDLADFFEKFTPVSDPLNPSIEEQVNQYNQLRELFN